MFAFLPLALVTVVAVPVLIVVALVPRAVEKLTFPEKKLLDFSTILNQRAI
jgi:hypothetical protein